MDKEQVYKKFGNYYHVNPDTFHMGTHYLLADHIAQRFAGFDVVLDACCGAGFMCIALAKYADHVIAVDINQEHLEEARENARIAGDGDKITFLQADILENMIFDTMPTIDAAVLDPDWARGKNKSMHAYQLSDMQPSADKLFNAVFHKTENIALRLPRQIALSQLEDFPPHEIENVYMNGEFKFYCIYFGHLAKKIGITEFKTSQAR